MMSVIINNKLYVKGASEIVLKNCTHWENSKNNFQAEPLTSETAVMINDIIEKMASKSLRTLCLGYRVVDDSEIREENNPKDSKGIYKIEK